MNNFSVPVEFKCTNTVDKLKNLQSKTVDDLNTSKNGSGEVQLSDDGVDLLLKNQHDVLSILEQLEFRLNKLHFLFSDAKNSLPISVNPLVASIPHHVDQKKYHQKKESEIIDGITKLIKTDTVVFADIESPPYSLLVLPILWPGVSWDISYHVHSSVESDLKALKTIEVFRNVSCKKNNNSIKVFVIWQHFKCNTKIVRSLTDTLFGEVNLLRLFNDHLATKTLIAADQKETTKVLDLINEINCSTNDRTSELYNLIDVSNTMLDLENIAVWSLLYKKNNSPPNIKKWMEPITKKIISLTERLHNHQSK